MGQISLSLPQSGLPNSTEDPKVTNDLTILQNVINGNLDATNVSATLAQSAAVNVAGQTVKGATNIAASESRSNVAYGTLTTPDQVTGIVLPVNGLIAVWYQATWQESVSGAARAAIFLNGNQLKIATASAAALQAAASGNGTINSNGPLTSFPAGLVATQSGGSYSGDATTGQAVGIAYNIALTQEVGGSVLQIGSNTAPPTVGGPCYIFAAAGTYAVSVQFKASSGSVTASNRKLWVQALSFA